MTCDGCGNTEATATRTYLTASGLVEVCNSSDCGDFKPRGMPDVFFSQPYHDENLADSSHPFGQEVLSKRHKATLLASQGLREDGDRVHGSVFRDAKRKPVEFKPEFKRKLRETVRKNIGIMKRRR